MPDFDTLFRKEKTLSIMFKDQRIRRVEFIPVHDGDTFLLTFEHFGSEWMQGVSVGFHTKGNAIVIQGKPVKNSSGFWQDTAPKEVSFQVKTKKTDDILMIWNVWKDERGLLAPETMVQQ